MSENATDQDQMEASPEDAPAEDIDPNLWDVPTEEGASRPGKTTAAATDASLLKERAILYGKSHAEFELVTMVCKECGEPAPKEGQKCTGKKCKSETFVNKALYIYSKSEGAIERVDQAFREWYDVKIAEQEKESRNWRHWGLRRRRVDQGLTAVYEAKYRLFGLIFQDLHDPGKHQELTATDFLSMTQAMQADIWRAFTEAQNAFDLISAMFPDRDDAKKKVLLQALCPTGISI